MIDAQDLVRKLARMFNFIYEINDIYYIMGSDYIIRLNEFKSADDIRIGSYKLFKNALEEKDESWIIEQYKRVRRYVRDDQPNSCDKDVKLEEFVGNLSKEELDSLADQISIAERYAYIAYGKQ